MEEKNVLQFSKTKPSVPVERLEKMFIENSSSVNIDEIASKVAIKLNTQVNEELKRNSEKIDKLTNGIANLINELKKQSVDEKNSSFKMARRNQIGAITVNSIDSHITHIVSLIHIAQLYKLRTNKGDKFSSQKARQLLIDLNLLCNPDFASKNLQGSSSIVKKYHFDIMYEIKQRLENPSKYNMNPNICLEWREKCFIPDETEIQQFIDEISSLLEVTSEKEN